MNSQDQVSEWYKREPVPTLVPWKTPLTIALRTKFLLTGVIFPIVCFLHVGLLGARPSFDAPWQSDDPAVYINLLMTRPTFLFFLPILCYSVVCMTIWCIGPRFSTRFLIRFGLYAGVVLAAMFVGMLVATTMLISPLCAAITAVGLAFIVWLAQVVIPKMRRFTILHLLIVTTVIALFLMLLRNVPDVFEFFVGLLGAAQILIIGSSATLAFVTFLRVSFAARFINVIVGSPPRPIVFVPAVLFWLCAFYTTWKFALQSMMNEYAKLPTQNPNCFVSAAAAHGHRRFVGPFTEKNSFAPVNLQMCRLKFLEYALASWSPAIHSAVRQIYNRLGPRLARVCRSNKWLADFTFLILKPFEYFAVIAQHLFKIRSRQIAEIYRRI